MPTSLSEISDKVQDQVIEAVKAGQDVVVDSVRSLAETLERVLPEPALSGLTGNLPVANEAVDSAFKFAGRVLETQLGFINRVFDAVTPKATAASPKAPKASKATAA